jgi:hypothetical protein
LLTRLAYPASIPTQLKLPGVWLVIVAAFPRLFVFGLLMRGVPRTSHVWLANISEEQQPVST